MVDTVPTRPVPTISEAKQQRLVAAVRAAEQAREDAVQRRSDAVYALFVEVGATTAAELLGISRQRVYELADRAAEPA